MGTDELSDPYTSSSPNGIPAAGKLDTGSLGPVFGAGWGLGPSLPQVAMEDAPDYLFAENYDAAFRRSWGERLTFHIGSAYLAGLTTGGSYGLLEGIRNSQGERRRIRINSVLNSMGRRGPGWGNSLGCLAMMCSILESLAYNVRDTDDLLNPVGAGCLTGVIYKITSGPRVALSAGLGLGAVAAAGSFMTKQISSRGMLKNFL
mmetsp:Transcript_25277/g.51351  ORF Transcript_25277/g.51351 Transcript_25277/m.51351 type:complete len:204 (-) Transcript_25277:199-810(-)